VEITGEHCYQCHWEADAGGNIDTAYHEGYNPATQEVVSGAKVDLVLYGSGARPTVYNSSTAIAYIANGSRAEIAKLTSHCLSCHNDANATTEPFGDGKSPTEYAWDGTSIAARYSQSGTTTWGKYTGAPNTAPKDVTKAYSAHGNATANEGGFSTSTGVDGDIPNTRAGSENIQCFDCHNSHGSDVAGVTASYASATTNGGILKSTVAGLGGYEVSYQPQAGGSEADKNAYNAGAALCFDCHLNANASSTPWGYSETFGATAPILGYRDTPYFGPGKSGAQERFAYKASRARMGGHLGASDTLNTTALEPIGGLCTPCHDPHGVSPTLQQAYAVPLLKGTWLTSPYKEDVAPARTDESRGDPYYGTDESSTPGYHIDQNTFCDASDSVWNWGCSQWIGETPAEFAGLCLRCHPQSEIDPDTTSSWKSMDRIHETVNGWGANTRHSYPCSKCHTVHNASLPRLMATNCLDYNHRGRVQSDGWPHKHSGLYGSGHFPSGGGDGTSYKYFFEGVKCHDDTNSDGWPQNQLWNNVTPW
jgi:hypothetical protein